MCERLPAGAHLLTASLSMSSVSGTPSMSESPRHMTPAWVCMSSLRLHLAQHCPPAAAPTVAVEDEAVMLVYELLLVLVCGSPGCREHRLISKPASRAH